MEIYNVLGHMHEVLKVTHSDPNHSLITQLILPTWISVPQMEEELKHASMHPLP